MIRPALLVLIPLSHAALVRLGTRFDVCHAPTVELRDALIRSEGLRIDAVLTNGTVGLRAVEIDAMPRLRLACALGAGHENIDHAYASMRGVVTANGAGSNADSVADHALALLLAVVRAIPAQDIACRSGIWRDNLPMRPQLARKRLGLLGMGAVGRRIAQRASAFDMPIAYHARRRADGVPYTYFEDPVRLADASDCLVVAMPGGASTRHLVDEALLDALGPRGFIVNIARGSIVDTEALARALRSGAIAGAGLDVYEGEPEPPSCLLELPNVMLTPHVAGTSPEAKDASLELFMENAGLHFNGQPVKTPI